MISTVYPLEALPARTVYRLDGAYKQAMRDRFGWDLAYLDFHLSHWRNIAALCAVSREEPHGFCLLVPLAHAVVVTALYLPKASAMSPWALVLAALRLRRDWRQYPLEGQPLVPFMPAGSARPPALHGHISQRYYLCAGLTDLPVNAPSSPLSLRAVSDNLQSLSRMLHETYRGHADCLFNSILRQPAGILTWLQDVCRRNICGHFLPCASALAVMKRRLAGVCLVSAVGPREAHIVQLAVHPAFQGQGVGHVLLARAFTQLRQAGYHRVSLTVSATRAFSWYLRRGFVCRAVFPAFRLRVLQQ